MFNLIYVDSEGTIRTHSNINKSEFDLFKVLNLLDIQQKIFSLIFVNPVLYKSKIEEMIAKELKENKDQKYNLIIESATHYFNHIVSNYTSCIINGDISDRTQLSHKAQSWLDYKFSKYVLWLSRLTNISLYHKINLVFHEYYSNYICSLDISAYDYYYDKSLDIMQTIDPDFKKRHKPHLFSHSIKVAMRLPESFIEREPVKINV